MNMSSLLPIKQLSFSSLLLKQLFIAIGLSFAIALPLVSVPAYIILKNNIESDIESIQTLSYQAVNEHLATGWQPHKMNRVYQSLRQEMPDAAFFLQKSPQFLSAEDDIIDPSTPTTAIFQKLIHQVEKTERKVINTNIMNGSINAGLPIVFKNQCLVCHAQQVQSGEVYNGALAGTIVLQVPMSIDNVSSTTILTLFFIFLLLFITIATVITNKLVHKKLLLPLSDLNRRVKRLKLSSHEQHIDWQRIPQEMLEIDQIDESISGHIQTIQSIYDKLDSLTVTEHEPGLFHNERYQEVISYELSRSHRYHHPFSVVLIKLVNVKVLNASAKNIDMEDSDSKYMVFGQILHNDSRETDLAFRLEEKIFAIVAPVTDVEGTITLKNDLYKRLSQSSLPANIPTSVVLPEYQFTVQIGSATFSEDNKNAQALMRAAVQDMQQSEELTGTYPPKKTP